MHGSRLLIHPQRQRKVLLNLFTFDETHVTSSALLLLFSVIQAYLMNACLQWGLSRMTCKAWMHVIVVETASLGVGE